MNSTRINMTTVDNDKLGEIVQFNVIACCPHCGNDTHVSQDALSSGHVQCQHCDENFKVAFY